MTALLHADHRAVLDRLAGGRSVLAFDFDGTLAPLTADPDAAAMRPSTAQGFASLCTRYPCAVVSGRALADLPSRLGPARPRWLIGNHGAEVPWASTPRPPEMSAVAAHLRLALAPLAGVWLEDKGHSLAVHRRPPARRECVLQHVEQVAAPYGSALRVFDGHDVTNIVDASAPSKGDAVRQLRQDAAADLVLYVGDDVTDEDVFRLEGDWLLRVRVQPDAGSAATHFLSAQSEIDALIAALLARRPD